MKINWHHLECRKRGAARSEADEPVSGETVGGSGEDPAFTFTFKFEIRHTHSTPLPLYISNPLALSTVAGKPDYAHFCSMESNHISRWCE